jgi:hypothetical protein
MNKDGERLLDELHCRLSELKVRVAKLEQYARLQDDINRCSVHYINDRKPDLAVLKNSMLGMSFEEAMAWFKRHKSIRRKAWERGVFMTLRLCGDIYQFNRDDITSMDWEILP